MIHCSHSELTLSTNDKFGYSALKIYPTAHILAEGQYYTREKTLSCPKVIQNTDYIYHQQTSPHISHTEEKAHNLFSVNIEMIAIIPTMHNVLITLGRKPQLLQCTTHARYHLGSENNYIDM